ncbi:zinc ribbon domain-containing protein [Chitinimonas naiadis]
MSYDFNNQSQLQLPNPLRVQNLFLGLSALVYLLAGVAILLLVRGHAQGNAGPARYLGIVLALGALLAGGRYAARCFSQLRFFFGRGRPSNLAAELKPGQAAENPSGRQVAEMMRHQALTIPEPNGPLDGLLYSTLPNLIYAPLQVQGLARRQFMKLLSMGALLASLVVALLFGGLGAGEAASKVTAWMGLVYLFFALQNLLGEVSAASVDDGRTVLTVKGLAILVVFSLVGPVLLMMFADKLPSLRAVSPFPYVFVVMVAGLVAYGLFFRALMLQLRAPPQTTVASKTDVWNINCHPGQVMEELDRVMQDGWTEKIPNRRYLRQEPQIDLDAKTGQFRAEMLEETQPMPAMGASPTLASTLAEPRMLPVLLLALLGALSHLVAAIALVALSLTLRDGFQWSAAHQWVILGLTFWALGEYSLAASQSLWMRFDFRSRLFWLEMAGRYVSASLKHGNMLQDAIQTSSSVVKIEAMTFRLWAAEIHTVTFDKDGARTVIGMAALPEVVKALAERLQQFINNQSIILAPAGNADMARHAHLAQLNQASRSPDAAKSMLENNPAGAGGLAALLSCPACQAIVAPDDTFCGSCGARLE